MYKSKLLFQPLLSPLLKDPFYTNISQVIPIFLSFYLFVKFLIFLHEFAVRWRWCGGGSFTEYEVRLTVRRMEDCNLLRKSAEKWSSETRWAVKINWKSPLGSLWRASLIMRLRGRGPHLTSVRKHFMRKKQEQLFFFFVVKQF